MPTKPSAPINFANDTNFDSGDYEGSPVKIDPDALGLAEQGFVPGSFLNFGILNWVLHHAIVTWLRDWVFAGTSDPDADTHIVETNADGRIAANQIAITATSSPAPSSPTLPTLFGSGANIFRAIGTQGLTCIDLPAYAMARAMCGIGLISPGGSATFEFGTLEINAEEALGAIAFHTSYGRALEYETGTAPDDDCGVISTNCCQRLMGFAISFMLRLDETTTSVQRAFTGLTEDSALNNVYSADTTPSGAFVGIVIDTADNTWHFAHSAGSGVAATRSDTSVPVTTRVILSIEDTTSGFRLELRDDDGDLLAGPYSASSNVPSTSDILRACSALRKTDVSGTARSFALYGIAMVPRATVG